eukprot:8344384-Lingulodinium_polyedra.AAC.1
MPWPHTLDIGTTSRLGSNRCVGGHRMSQPNSDTWSAVDVGEEEVVSLADGWSDIDGESDCELPPQGEWQVQGKRPRGRPVGTRGSCQHRARLREANPRPAAPQEPERQMVAAAPRAAIPSLNKDPRERFPERPLIFRG